MSSDPNDSQLSLNLDVLENLRLEEITNLLINATNQDIAFTRQTFQDVVQVLKPSMPASTMTTAPTTAPAQTNS